MSFDTADGGSIREACDRDGKSMALPATTDLAERGRGGHMGSPAVVLFDVDETLVHTGGSGARSWKQAFDTLYGIPADIGEYTSAGETDPFVGRTTFRAVIGREPTRDELGRLYSQYLLRLADDIWTSDGYRVLDGVEDTLTKLSETGVVLGIVSGAMEGAARTKLAPANLNRFFVFGGYGSDSPDRVELISLAITKASRLHEGRLRPEEIFVVGDTPRDVQAARAVGAVAVAVASGKYPVEELRATGMDYVLSSLSDPFPGME
jgi:phosphoglycolate phosphatase